MKKIHVIGGGTFSYVRNHLALAAPAFGQTARALDGLFDNAIWAPEAKTKVPNWEWMTTLHLTKMAEPSSKWITNEDVKELIGYLVDDPETRVILMNAALCDYNGEVETLAGDKYGPRLKTSEGVRKMVLHPSDKILKDIRKTRKDIFLVAFKTTCGATPDEQYLAGLNLLKSNSCNLVLANDTKTHLNMVIVPEEARYGVTTDRTAALQTLVDITMARTQLTFTRSTVVPGEAIGWRSEAVPETLRRVVDHCIKAGAYKPFRGSTAGHFAFRQPDGSILTSIRKTNYNNLDDIGLVKIEADGPDKVIAHGFKPSVGGQSQRRVFEDHPESDCIVHFHSPLARGSRVNIRPQWMYECGSHQCGENTSNGLMESEADIKAVFLEQHGPNIVFNSRTDPEKIIHFIDQNFDLSQKTGGLVT